MSDTSGSRFAAAAAPRPAEPGPVATRPPRPPRKYTILLARDLADDIDRFMLELQLRLGFGIDRSDIVRGLLAMMLEDSTLANDLGERLTRERDAAERDT